LHIGCIEFGRRYVAGWANGYGRVLQGVHHCQSATIEDERLPAREQDVPGIVGLSDPDNSIEAGYLPAFRALHPLYAPRSEPNGPDVEDVLHWDLLMYAQGALIKRLACDQIALLC
jgi:hypothetical protein